MSITANHIISDIRNIATSGSNPIEFKIEDSQILYWINEVRSMLISQALQRRQDISDIWIQRIPCLELELVDEAECCDVTTGCYILRTVRELPQTIEVFGDNMVIRVVGPSGEIIPKSNSFSNLYTKYNKYTSNKANWEVKNRKIYIKNTTLLDNITAYVILDDPSELATFNDCDDTTCWSYDSTYPCSLKMASMITDIVIKTKVYPFLQLPADNRNDADNSGETIIPKKI